MTIYHVQVNDGTGWQTAATYPTADSARDACEWYRDRRLRSRVVADDGYDEKLSVAVDRMMEREL